MDKIKIIISVPPNYNLETPEGKQTFTQLEGLFANANLPDFSDKITEILGQRIIQLNFPFIWNKKNKNFEASLFVSDIAETDIAELNETITPYADILETTGLGPVNITTESNVEIQTIDQSLIDYGNHVNQGNTSLPTNSLFSYFEQLQFSLTDNGAVFVPTDHGIEKYSNNGTISLLGNFDYFAWELYRTFCKLWTSSTIRFIEPYFCKKLTEQDQYKYYAEFINPTGEVGIPFSGDLLDSNIPINEDYIKQFIDQIAEIVEANIGWEDNYFPSVITLGDRLRDSTGYYFKFINFERFTKTEFVINELSYLEILLNNLSKLDKSALMEYARTKWN